MLRPRPYEEKAMCHRKMCTHIQTCLGFTMLRVEKVKEEQKGAQPAYSCTSAVVPK